MHSSEANAASATFWQKLAKELVRRHYAAATLRETIALWYLFVISEEKLLQAHTASRKIQWFWKKRLERIRKKRVRLNLEREMITRIQAQMRRYLAAESVRKKKNRIFQYSAKIIARFIRYSGKEIKRKRGRITRCNVHATRIQARARGWQGEHEYDVC